VLLASMGRAVIEAGVPVEDIRAALSA